MLKSESNLYSLEKTFTESEEFFVVFSNVAFLVPAFYFFVNKSFILSILFLMVAIFSTLHHISPNKSLFRILDWTSAMVLIFIYLGNIEKYNNTLILVSIMALFLWYISFKAFGNKKTRLYNITHTTWHILSAIIFLFI